MSNKVSIFINLIEKKGEKNLDILNLPNKNKITKNKIKYIDTKNYKLNELILWYSFIDENLNKLFDPDTSEKIFLELLMNLYEDSELDPIMIFINEKS